jgi:hypothetical protein
MAKKIQDDGIDNIEIVGDISGDDLTDVKTQLKKLKKESEDADDEDDGEMAITTDDSEDDDKASVDSDEIVINEEYSSPFADEDKYYKSFEKFLKEKEDQK